MPPRPVLTIQHSGERRPLVFCWGVSSFFGWGVYGLNLMLALAEHPEIALFSGLEFRPPDVVLDPLRMQRISDMARLSQTLWSTLAASSEPEVELAHPLLEGLGRDLTSGSFNDGRTLSGRPSIGVAFLEEVRLSPEGRDRADRLALIIAGSSWNEAVLRSHGIDAVTTVLQGVDTALYHPAPRFGMFPGRFVIFSGGKLEFRKGQDLVLAAFRAFHQRHPEALLLCAWHSPWSDLAEHAVGHPGMTTPPVGEDGMLDVVGWAVENGVPADAVFAVGQAPNIMMPNVVREADVALFANRCEGGTNLVAMECMACGIPSIVSANTGHLDLLAAGDTALRLERQGPAVSSFYDTADWGESDVEEMLEKLEFVWRDRAAAAAIGARGAAWMAQLTWPAQCRLLLRAIEPFED